MAPKLYMHPASYPVRSVLMTAEAIGLKLDLFEINLLNKEQYTPEFLKMNPTHTLPTLDDDGFILWNSNEIVIYLIEKYGKDDSLYPKDLKKRSIINQMLFFNEGILFSKAAAISRSVILHGLRKIPEELLKELEEAVNYLETFLTRTKFVAGEEVSVADICIVACISSINSTYYSINSAKFPNITKWISKMESFPFYRINLSGLEVFKTIFNGKLSGQI